MAPVVPVVARVAAIDGDQARVQEVLLLAGQHGGTCHESRVACHVSRHTAVTWHTVLTVFTGRGSGGH